MLLPEERLRPEPPGRTHPLCRADAERGTIGVGAVTSAREATTRAGVLGMGRIEATTLAHERSVLATNPTAAREHSNVCYSITNWCLALVCRSNPARLLPTSEALAGARETR